MTESVWSKTPGGTAICSGVPGGARSGGVSALRRRRGAKSKPTSDEWNKGNQAGRLRAPLHTSITPKQFAWTGDVSRKNGAIGSRVAKGSEISFGAVYTTLDRLERKHPC